jgi:hypothetical protein
MSELYAWSSAGRAKGFFGISEVRREGVTVQTTTGNYRFVPRQEFESLFPLWSEYRSGAIQRHTLRELSVNCSYVISIFH